MPYCHPNCQLFGKLWMVWVAATVYLQIKLIFNDNSAYQGQSDGFEIFIYSSPLSSCISTVICLSSSAVAFVVLLYHMLLLSSALVCVIRVWNATKDSGEQENYINPSLNPSIFRLKKKKKNPCINVCKPNNGTRSNHLWLHLQFSSLLTWRLKKGLISSPKSCCLATWAVSSQSLLWTLDVPKRKNTGKIKMIISDISSLKQRLKPF